MKALRYYRLMTWGKLEFGGKRKFQEVNSTTPGTDITLNPTDTSINSKNWTIGQYSVGVCTKVELLNLQIQVQLCALNDIAKSIAS